MPSLELQFMNGSVEQRELSRSQPLSIGRQSFNDVCIAEDGIAAMHSRISWNKSAFEISSATGQGVDVNGIAVSRAALKSGDVIRIGSVDLVFVDADAPVEEEVGLQLVADPEPVRPFPVSKPPVPTPIPLPPIPKAKSAERGGKPKKNVEPIPKPVEDMSLFMGKVYTESQALAAVDFGDQEADDEDDSNPKQLLKRIGESSYERVAPQETPPAPKTMSMSSSRARPGEQDIFRSPLVVGLGAGGLLLLLVTGIFWFLIGREQAARHYDRAVSELTSGQYAQSIASFEEFLQKYSSHSLRRAAERGLDRALVQKEISGATPAWKRGQENLKKLISNHRNDVDFADLRPTLFKLAEEISLGAAKTAETTRDAELLLVSDNARAIVEEFADKATPPTATLNRIKEAYALAEKAIGKQNTFDSAMATVEAALANKQPMVALIERERLVRRFADYANQKRVKEALEQAIDLERSMIAIDETERPATTQDDAPESPEPTLGLFHTRSRTEDVSQGRVAYVRAKESCLAVDTLTGEIVWRRVIGPDAPFFPLLAAGNQSALLLYDARHKTLDSRQPTTGKLIWRQPLDALPRAAPLVHEGQIYLATNDRALCRIDLDSGKLTAKVKFSQNVLGPPMLSHSGQHLLIAGEMAMIYSLTLRPLAAAAMTFTDHAAGAIVAPPVSMGKLMLLCENEKSESARLRVWDAGQPTAPLIELVGASVPGAVRDAPVIRGNQLVVASTNEHLAAFSVTDETGRAGLAPVAQYRVKDGYGGPMFVALGPDRQFWSASSAFRRFEIGADTIRMDQNAQAQGIASQPLQLVGDQFFVARTAPFHQAVIFSAVDRERMLSPWRIVVGAEPLELTVGRDGGTISINEAGQVVTLGPGRLKQGGVELKAATELELPANPQPLRASRLHDGRLALAATGAEATQVVIVSGSGQIDATLKLTKGDVVEANPVLFDDGLVVPLASRLKWLPLGAGKKSVQDWLAPVEENAVHHWRFLTRLDGNELIGCDDKGLLTRVQLRTTDAPHLAGATTLQLDQPVDVAPALRGETLLVADAAGTVKQLHARSFDVDGQRAFAAPVRGVWTAGQTTLVWAGDDNLHAVTPGKELTDHWSLPLAERQPAGSPVEWSGQIWIASRNGLVIAVDPANGQESRRIQLPQSLSLGLRVVGDDLYAVACDGTLYRLEAKGQP